jgi:hypothetical protein
VAVGRRGIRHGGTRVSRATARPYNPARTPAQPITPSNPGMMRLTCCVHATGPETADRPWSTAKEQGFAARVLYSQAFEETLFGFL